MARAVVISKNFLQVINVSVKYPISGCAISVATAISTCARAHCTLLNRGSAYIKPESQNRYSRRTSKIPERPSKEGFCGPKPLIPCAYACSSPPTPAIFDHRIPHFSLHVKKKRKLFSPYQHDFSLRNGLASGIRSYLLETYTKSSPSSFTTDGETFFAADIGDRLFYLFSSIKVRQLPCANSSAGLSGVPKSSGT